MWRGKSYILSSNHDRFMVIETVMLVLIGSISSLDDSQKGNENKRELFLSHKPMYVLKQMKWFTVFLKT